MNRDYFFCFDKLTYLKGPRPEGCIFCLVCQRDPRVKNLSVYRDNLFVVSVNLYPYNPGHLLVFPVRHVEDVRALSHEEELRLNALTRYLLDKMDTLHQPAGYNIGYNMGPAAGASIEHLHLHIIPRYHRELGIADLVAGKRVLVEAPQVTADRLMNLIDQDPFSNTSS